MLNRSLRPLNEKYSVSLTLKQLLFLYLNRITMVFKAFANKKHLTQREYCRFFLVFTH